MSGHSRRALLEERPRISEIRLAVQENKLLDPSRVSDADYNWFSENPGIWAWEEDGRILGFSAADTRDGTIWALFIDPDHEGRGIGRALLTRACDVLREAGHRSASIAAGWTALHVDERGEQVFRLERNEMRWNRIRFHLISFARNGDACCSRHDEFS